MKVVTRIEETDKHHVDINHLLYHKGKLYSASDDGKIKVWNPELQKVAETQAHVEPVYCLAASEDCLFSCPTKGNIKSWELGSLKEKRTLSIDDQQYFFKINFSRGCLFYGADRNNIKVFENIKKGNEKDSDNYMPCTMIFTVKDEDLVVTEVKINGTSLLYGEKKYTFMGKNPVTLIGHKMFSFVSRNGRDILIHDNNPLEHFQQMSEVKNAHSEEITALAGAVWKDQEILFSGGLDKTVKKWHIGLKGSATLAAECKVDVQVKAIISGDPGEVYVAGKDGTIVKISV